MGDRNLEDSVTTLAWGGDNLKLIDQRKLPFEEVFVECRTALEAASAIKDMVVRGAPAIGVTAAYGVALAAIEYRGSDKKGLLEHLANSIKLLSGTRPTAVNLFWALKKMDKLIKDSKDLKPGQIRDKIISEAKKIEIEDIKINKMIGQNGLKVFLKLKKEKFSILTHCNAGALATAGYGTALGVIRKLNEENLVKKVLVDETRPYLQGARLTSWELQKEKINFFVITDNMPAYFMSKGEVDAVVVGADRIAANGDTANKIGTLGLSILAKKFGIPFFVAAPVSTIDFDTKTGESIEIEIRSEDEIRKVMGRQIVPDYMDVINPAFDVSKASNITAIITEKGPLYPPYIKSIRKVKDGGRR